VNRWGFCLIVALLLSGCNGVTNKIVSPNASVPKAEETAPQQKVEPTPQQPQPGSQDSARQEQEPESITVPVTEDGVVKEPSSLAVLVNKQYRLPDGYRPQDLVEDQQLLFLSSEKGEKRMMRKEVAAALEQLFAGAQKDGLQLAVVSAFRSFETQKMLFDYYVRTQGEEEARRYSAVPGHSEHQTGLAVDISGSDGKCAAEDCFADTPEGKWLAEHAHEYGFIIRYPKGKEAITGYAYEPWHLRYVGKELAREIQEKGVTLEEFLKNGVKVSR
jgi:D-alanyl-D-alanine carboxypeptidase